MATASPTELGNFLAAARRYRKQVIIFTIVICLLGASIILFLPRTYRSESRLFLRVGRENVGVDPTATVGQTVSLQNGRDYELQSAMDVLQSRQLATKVVDNLGPEFVMYGPPGESKEPSLPAKFFQMTVGAAADAVKSLDPIPLREEAIIRVEGSVEVEAELESAVITVSADAKTPEIAQRVLTDLVSEYENMHSRMHRSQMSQEFFDDQREVLREQFDVALGRFRDAKNEMGVASIEERRINEERRLRSVEMGIFKTAQQQATAQAKVEDLKDKLVTIPDRLTTEQTSVPNTGADMLQDQLYQLELRKLELQSRYSPTHPMCKRCRSRSKKRKKVYAQQKELRQQTVDDVNPIHRELQLQCSLAEVELAGHDARLAALDQQRTQLKYVIAELNDNDAQLQELQRDVELAQNNFAQYAESYEQSRIDNALQAEKISNLSIVQDATLAYKPVSPRKGIVAALTLLIAMCGSVLLVLVLDRLDTTIATAEDVEKELQLPVLGTLPKATRSQLTPT